MKMKPVISSDGLGDTGNTGASADRKGSATGNTVGPTAIGTPEQGAPAMSHRRPPRATNPPSSSGRSRISGDPTNGPTSAGARPSCWLPPSGESGPSPQKRYRRIVPWAILAGLLVMMIGTEVLERQFSPGMSVGVRHLILTAQAIVITAATTAGIFSIMRRQEQALTDTAERITAVIETYQKSRSSQVRFENPHLLHCRRVLDCHNHACPMFDAEGTRCWQIVALSRAGRPPGAPAVEIQQCHECAVYRQSCPDKLTELGESFNNLLFLLEGESREVGRMRARMAEKEKMVALGQIAAGVAHEVGNPLSSISSIVQMLRRSRNGSPNRDQLALIETHIDRISTIVRQLVNMARPRAKRWERLDVGQSVEEAIRLISFDRRARGIEIDFEEHTALPPTFALRDQLQQVFINLFLNALDAMPDGGKLTVRAATEGDMIVVRTTDTGTGINPDIGRRIFEPFFTTKDPGQGTGLGLAVSYSIVQEHGGAIDLDSNMGTGTTVTVRIPVLSKAPEG